MRNGWLILTAAAVVVMVVVLVLVLWLYVHDKAQVGKKKYGRIVALDGPSQNKLRFQNVR